MVVGKKETQKSEKLKGAQRHSGLETKALENVLKAAVRTRHRAWRL